jgi:aminoglycoside phosphotransferase (APT) family kinase protein
MTDVLVDPDGLARFLKEHAPEYAGEFTVQRLGEGQSCLTFLVTGDGWEVVLRRPPRGDLPPGAFDVTREFRVTRALHDAGAAVPVARPIVKCVDTDVIGAPFYLMESVRGHVVRQEIPKELDALADRRGMGDELLLTLEELQAVDHEAIGLGNFGKPDGYLQRQVDRFTKQWGFIKNREIEALDELGAWIAERIPTPRSTVIIHGDYKLDNVIFAKESPAKLVAVVDWEMAALGDPMIDLGWLLYFWRDPGDPSFGLTVSSVSDQEGFPRRAELLQRYGRRHDVHDIAWYTALAGWKIAIIMEASYARFRAGITDHPMFAQLEQGVPALAERARLAMRGEFGL